MSNFQLLKASAGSGKTHSLAYEYLRLIFTNPDNYSRILATTFTRKATAEMKSRVISELYKLSTGEQSHYFDPLSNDTGIKDPEKIKSRAAGILRRILYDYTNFQITTIDSFFQRIVKNFASELGIQYGYNVEMEPERAIIKAIDLVFDDLGKDHVITKWLLEFANERLDDEKNWNPKQVISEFAKNLLTEKFQKAESSLQNLLQNKDLLKSIFDQLKNDIYIFESFLESKSKEAIGMIEKSGLLITDFKGGSRSFANTFSKIVDKNDFELNPTFINAFNNPENWFTKTVSQDIRSKIELLYNKGLNEITGEIISFIDRQQGKYIVATETRRLLHILGLLTDISVKLRQIREEENMLLISDVNPLLNGIIKDNDSPFIYEKTGSKYRHFLVDEFQDTSKLQWENILPLIKNSLSENNYNLVVGDVKQSIYRWRGGDMSLILKKAKTDIGEYFFRSKNLEYNWRSDKNIIDFNNAFFKTASVLVQQKVISGLDETNDIAPELVSAIEYAYQDAEQKSPLNKTMVEGFVEISFFDQNTFFENADRSLIEKIDLLTNNGFKPSDITILVRKSSEGRRAAETIFRDGRFKVISKDSLFTDASPAVRILVTALYIINDPADQVKLAQLISELNFHTQKKETFPGEILLDNGLLTKLPEEFLNIPDNIKSHSLYELCEDLIRIFRLHEKQENDAFLYAFLDIILEYSSKNNQEITGFLEWWEENKARRSVKMPDQTEAIRIMTIHQSKGLDFNVVIIPYCNWNLDHDATNAPILWVIPKEAPMNELGLMPLRYVSHLKKTSFSANYFEEKVQIHLDNLNLLYVAFTRAVNGLIVFAPDSTSFTSVGHLLRKAIDSETGFTFSSNFNSEMKIFRLGESWTRTGTTDSITREQESLDFISRNSEPSIRIRKDIDQYFEETQNPRSIRINRGKILHALLSSIYYENELKDKLSQFIIEFNLSENESEEIIHFANKIFSNPEVKTWFSIDWKVINEKPILVPDASYKIPDRIIMKGNEIKVIDFKFGKENPEHEIQVREYLKLLNQMGFENPGGILYYAGEDKIIHLT